MRFYRWDQEASSVDTNAALFQVAEVLVRRISHKDTAERLARSISERDIVRISSFAVDYSELTAYDSELVRQIRAFFEKRSDVDLGIDRRQAAIKTYFMAERHCALVNKKFRDRADGMLFAPHVERALSCAQRKIRSILGPAPLISELRLRFGPGATTTLPRRMASPRAKLSDTLTCSRQFFLELLPEVLAELPHLWALSDEGLDDRVYPEVVIDDSRLEFVPKTAKTDRSIAVEPGLNLMVQLALGDEIAKKLRRHGIDIRDQSANQRAAREGSLTGALATLDLSSASDSIAWSLVHELIPEDWFMLLDASRSHRATLKDRQGRKATVNLEKFGTNGNGFTFPLETLIFYALSSSVMEEYPEKLKEILVYGDDIIVPSEFFNQVTDILEYLGFTVNKAKSFATGPFRESCGHDYYLGIAIRPLYIKGPLHGFDVFRLYNFFVEKDDIEVASLILDLIDPSLRIWGPKGYGCGHLVGGPPLRPKGRAKGWSGYLFDTYTFKSRRDFKPRWNDRVLPLYCTYIRENADTVRELSPDGFLIGSTPTAVHSKDGILGTTVPGTKGYNRISVYTLDGNIM